MCKSQELTPYGSHSLSITGPVVSCVGAGPCNGSVLPADPRPVSKAGGTFSFSSYGLLRNDASFALGIRMAVALSSQGDRGRKQVTSAREESVPGNHEKVPGLTRSELGPAG